MNTHDRISKYLSESEDLSESPRDKSKFFGTGQEMHDFVNDSKGASFFVNVRGTTASHLFEIQKDALLTTLKKIGLSKNCEFALIRENSGYVLTLNE